MGMVDELRGVWEATYLDLVAVTFFAFSQSGKWAAFAALVNHRVAVRTHDGQVVKGGRHILGSGSEGIKVVDVGVSLAE